MSIYLYISIYIYIYIYRERESWVFLLAPKRVCIIYVYIRNPLLLQYRSIIDRDLKASFFSCCSPSLAEFKFQKKKLNGIFFLIKRSILF